MYILVWHFIADFIMQSREMAINKSSSIKWLTKHVKMYCYSLLVGSLLVVFVAILCGCKCYHLTPLILLYILVNSVLHWITDYFTSKQTARLYKKELYKKEPNYHNFFVMIGFDQLIHLLCLIGTYIWIFK
jgi:hypothetical protein